MSAYRQAEGKSMRTVAIVIALVFAGACANGAEIQAGGGSGSPSAPAETTPEAAGELLYESDFSTPEEGLFGGDPGFEAVMPEGGTIRGEYTSYEALNLSVDLPAKNEQYDLESIANTGGVFAGDRELIDLADVTIQVYGKPGEWETGVAYGLHCREQTGEPGFFYEAGIGMDDKRAGVTLFRVDGPEGFHELASAPLPDSVDTTGKEWSLMRLDCIGDTLTLFLNGEEVISAKDTTYSSGMASMFAGAYIPEAFGKKHPGASASADFDNFEIRER
jgi:hypothetical protein